MWKALKGDCVTVLAGHKDRVGACCFDPLNGDRTLQYSLPYKCHLSAKTTRSFPKTYPATPQRHIPARAVYAPFPAGPYIWKGELSAGAVYVRGRLCHSGGAHRVGACPFEPPQ